MCLDATTTTVIVHQHDITGLLGSLTMIIDLLRWVDGSVHLVRKLRFSMVNIFDALYFALPLLLWRAREREDPFGLGHRWLA